MKTSILAAFIALSLFAIFVAAEINVNLGVRPYGGGYGGYSDGYYGARPYGGYGARPYGGYGGYGPGYGAGYGPGYGYGGGYGGGKPYPKYGYADRGYYGFRNYRY